MDSELTTLYAKVAELEKERDAAIELAEIATTRLQDSRIEAGRYRTLYLHAERMRKAPVLPDVRYLENIVIEPISPKKKRTVHDWIWTSIWLAAAGAVVYVLGWVLVWPK